jgi:hypothetical protein
MTLPAEIVPTNRLLTSGKFHRLADVTPEVEWFANFISRAEWMHATVSTTRTSKEGPR